MKEFIEKLIGRIMLESASCKVYKLINPNKEDIAEFNAYKKCIEIVNELAEEYNNGWIPCSERLPVYLDNVLVCAKNGGRTIAHLKHTPIEWRDMHMNKIDDVIAWKHLDAPYQPKGE